MASTSPERNGRGGPLSAAVSVTIALGVGAIGAFATTSSIATWYAALNKPPFNPPNAVFGPVWTALYVMMAIAVWRVWRAPAGQNPRDRRRALVAYAVQLALNLCWSLIFFGLRKPGLALAEVAVLFAAVLACANWFWRIDRVAGLLMLPYAAWVAFASLLNFEVWRLN